MAGADTPLHIQYRIFWQPAFIPAVILVATCLFAGISFASVNVDSRQVETFFRDSSQRQSSSTPAAQEMRGPRGIASVVTPEGDDPNPVLVSTTSFHSRPEQQKLLICMIEQSEAAKILNNVSARDPPLLYEFIQAF